MRKLTLLMATLMCGAWCATAQTTEKGYEYVDLGLPSGLKWATCNVGATAPEDYGNYYAWGETEPKTTYDWSTYKWCNGRYDTQTKYCTSGRYGTVDDKTVLELADDAARANWGGQWRMPTDDEWTELRENCTWTWTSDYNGTGVAGRIVTSKTNSNSIFFPAAGYRGSDDLNNAGGNGFYWSSSLYTDGPLNAWGVYFCSANLYGGSLGRYCGRSVRGVVKESGSITALQPATAAVNIYTQNGRIVCAVEFRIYDLLGRDVTRENGSLHGIYVVKSDEMAVKVVVK